MKKQLLAFCLSASIALPCASLAQSAPVCSGKWVMRCGAGSIPSLDSKISASVEGTTVSGLTEVQGHFKALNAKLGSVLVHGAASLAKSTVQHNLTVDGVLTLYQVHVAGDLSVNGSTTVSHSQIKGSSHFNGTFNADNAQFAGPLFADTATITFEHTRASDITVGKGFSMIPFYRPKIHIDNHSTVTGNITFTGGKNGIVYVSANSHFTGKVISGVAFFEKAND